HRLHERHGHSPASRLASGAKHDRRPRVRSPPHRADPLDGAAAVPRVASPGEAAGETVALTETAPAATRSRTGARLRVVEAGDLTSEEPDRWLELRGSNPVLDSPYFHP